VKALMPLRASMLAKMWRWSWKSSESRTRLGSRYDSAMREYTAIVKQSGDYWIGWVEEVPDVNCQEATREELVDTLRVTLAEALDLTRADA
jgi:predicted RNase H-like HicB family nuclease